MTSMIDEKLARLRMHRNSIGRYRRLLKTTLTDLERDFIEQRLAEEQSAMEALAASTFPVSFNIPKVTSPAAPRELLTTNDASPHRLGYAPA
jgi:hypothetical protein